MSCGFRARAPGYARCLSPGVGGSDGTEHRRSGPGHWADADASSTAVPCGASGQWQFLPLGLPDIKEDLAHFFPERVPVPTQAWRSPPSAQPLWPETAQRAMSANRTEKFLKTLSQEICLHWTTKMGPKWHVFFDSSLFFWQVLLSQTMDTF